MIPGLLAWTLFVALLEFLLVSDPSSVDPLRFSEITTVMTVPGLSGESRTGGRVRCDDVHVFHVSFFHGTLRGFIGEGSIFFGIYRMIVNGI